MSEPVRKVSQNLLAPAEVVVERRNQVKQAAEPELVIERVENR
jgi:hypothetical protein